MFAGCPAFAAQGELGAGAQIVVAVVGAPDDPFTRDGLIQRVTYFALAVADAAIIPGGSGVIAIAQLTTVGNLVYGQPVDFILAAPIPAMPKEIFHGKDEGFRGDARREIGPQFGQDEVVGLRPCEADERDARRLREFGIVGRLGRGIVVLDACAVIRQRRARQKAEVERIVQSWEKRLVWKTGAAIKTDARAIHTAADFSVP